MPLKSSSPIQDRRRSDRRRSEEYMLLQRSTLYHCLISDLADLFDVSISSTQRSRAFQLVSDFVEQLEARK